jgi:hypothetical protein
VDCQAVDWVSADRKIDGVWHVGAALVNRSRCCDRYYYCLSPNVVVVVVSQMKRSCSQVSKVRG